MPAVAELELAVAARCAATRGGPRKIAAKAVNVDAHSTRAQLADIEEAILAFAATFREPDRGVDRHELAWWLAQEERMEIRAELATRSSTRGLPALT